jgi:hypothetical protein
MLLHDPGPVLLLPSQLPLRLIQLIPPGLQHEFGLPGPLVDGMATAAKRSSLEVAGELLFAAVKTATWVATEELVKLGEVQLVLGEGFVVSVDRDAAVLEGVRQDLPADPELVGAGPAAVLPCVVDHAVDGYGPVLGAINDAVEEVEEAVFTLVSLGRPSASTTCRAGARAPAGHGPAHRDAGPPGVRVEGAHR